MLIQPYYVRANAQSRANREADTISAGSGFIQGLHPVGQKIPSGTSLL
jgi:hypothetical protein